MTAPALIPQADLTRAAKVANKQGCAIEIKAGNITYRIIPNIPNDGPQGRRPIDETEPVL
jgi:hypothetical protein